MHTVVETPDFIRDVRMAGMSAEERREVVDYLSRNPLAGVEIPGTGGARKIRFAGRGKGKSGGYRVITFYAGEKMPIFLLNLFAKGDRVNLSMAERNALRQILGHIAAAYRRR
ncbi:type II toxin-antitoxin system RelE/ParE family toxin [Oceanibaculum pacificum]|uniref:Addiction module toxin RelE n=1 Tax=Oceanibaculum pacificum TaxID=580166 RepID=A0A154VZU1_9PROT|nr:type II toxin-antitoxin system RelE/ParE family toxin [Oceanibaculum pacificum]KZD06768.1 addiction module toxin RelE [Oceanibaculum pacificum]